MKVIITFFNKVQSNKLIKLHISSLSLSLTVLSQNDCKLAGTKFSAVLLLVDFTIAAKLFGLFEIQWDI